jgi:hypothetical protein
LDDVFLSVTGARLADREVDAGDAQPAEEAS